MAFLIKGGEGALQFVACCDAMRRAARVLGREEASCAPFVDMCWPPRLHGCDAAIESDPIAFCPWCGKPIVPKSEVSAEGAGKI